MFVWITNTQPPDRYQTHATCPTELPDQASKTIKSPDCGLLVVVPFVIKLGQKYASRPYERENFRFHPYEEVSMSAP